MKKYKQGFVFGKFMPMHYGHIHMIETAIKNCEHVTILVCSLQSEPIPGFLRYQWMCTYFNPKFNSNVTVGYVTDEVPQYPHEHPDFWNIWTALFKRNIPADTDVVFTSEDYGYEVAARLGIRHEIVDIDRSVVPVSGTKIRTNPLEHWSYIPDCVKSYFAKKVVLVGAESTGKSTLAKAIAEHYGVHCMDEYGREYCEKLAPDAKLTSSDFINIARGHNYRYFEEERRGAKLMVLDTDLIVTEAYGKMYLGESPAYVTELNRMIHGGVHHATIPNLFYLVTDNVVPWEEDGTRIYLKKEQREEHQKIILDTLKKYNCEYTFVLGNTVEERLVNAIAAIDFKFPGL